MYKLKFWLKVLALILLWGVLLPRLVHAQSGSLDSSFSNDGKLTLTFSTNGHSNANAVAVQPDGKILMAGGTWVPSIAGTSQIALARYLPGGEIDPDFGIGGKITSQVNGLNTYANQILLLPGGKILLAATVTNEVQWSLALLRYQTNGLPDPTFGVNGVVTTPAISMAQGVNAVALQSDGKIVAAGYRKNATGLKDFAVLRFLANGQPDAGFDGDGLAISAVGESYSTAYSVLVQADGRLVATGYAVGNGVAQFAAVRFKGDGTPDLSFSGDGKVLLPMAAQDNYAYKSILQPDGKILLAGTADLGGSGVSAVTNFAVARLKTNGEPDETFSGDGKLLIPVSGHADGCRAMVLQPDGKIILGGYAHSNTELSADAALVRLQPNGHFDYTFDGDGISILALQGNSSDAIHALALQADGKIVAAGFALPGQFQVFALARILSGPTVATTVPPVFSGKLSLYPNPVHEQATLAYELLRSDRISINLYDLQGKCIRNLLPPGDKTAGKHVEYFQFDQDLPPGIYLLTIEYTGGKMVIQAVF